MADSRTIRINLKSTIPHRLGNVKDDEVEKSWTWKQFLDSKGLDVKVSDGIIVTNFAHHGQFELDDPIQLTVNMYPRSSRALAVRLLPRTATITYPNRAPRDRTSRSRTSRAVVVPPSQMPSRSGMFDYPFSPRSVSSQLDYSSASDGEEDIADRGDSPITTIDDNSEEGIATKNLALQRMNLYPVKDFIRMRNELLDLKARGNAMRWTRRCCYSSSVMFNIFGV